MTTESRTAKEARVQGICTGSRRVLKIWSPPPGRKCGFGAISQGMGILTFMKLKPKAATKAISKPQNAGQETLDDRFRQELRHHIAIGPAHGLQNPDLPRPLGDVSGHGLEGDENGNDDGDQRGGHGELVGQGKEAAQELQEGVRGADCRLFTQDVL